MPSTDKQTPAIASRRQSLIVAIMPATAVILTLAAAYVRVAHGIQTTLFSITTCIMLGLLLHLYLVISRSVHSRALAPARLHLLLHLVPLIFFLIYLSGPASSLVIPVLVLLFVLFFASGRKTWGVLSKRFPSTLLYRIFYRGNTAFLISFPLLYLASLVAPGSVTFFTIKSVALFYFPIHFMMLGLASVKIQSDLRSRDITA
jgi:hypothetical protein